MEICENGLHFCKHERFGFCRNPDAADPDIKPEFAEKITVGIFKCSTLTGGLRSKYETAALQPNCDGYKATGSNGNSDELSSALQIQSLA